MWLTNPARVSAFRRECRSVSCLRACVHTVDYRHRLTCPAMCPGEDHFHLNRNSLPGSAQQRRYCTAQHGKLACSTACSLQGSAQQRISGRKTVPYGRSKVLLFCYFSQILHSMEQGSSCPSQHHQSSDLTVTGQLCQRARKDRESKYMHAICNTAWLRSHACRGATTVPGGHFTGTSADSTTHRNTRLRFFRARCWRFTLLKWRLMAIFCA